MNPLKDCDCHHKSHFSGKPSRHDFLRIVSKREGVPLELIDAVIPAVIACPRWNTLEKSTGWLNAHFPIETARPAIDIIRIVYE